MNLILRGLRGFVLAAIIIALRPPSAFAEDGYELWLRYHRVADAALLKHYRSTVTGLLVSGESATARATAAELTRGLGGLLDTTIPSVADVVADGALIAGTGRSAVISSLGLDAELRTLGGEGYLIRSVRARGRRATVIAANTDIGVLYGAFHFLRLLQTNQRIDTLGISDRPRIQHRILNHWDNLDGSVERGYAGRSLWDWYTLPGYKSPRYTDYARANASIGINGTVLTNVNANATSLTADYLKKVAALADVFRPYGIRVYLTARFSAPIEIGGLKTADPLAPEVKAWWAAKVAEIYKVIPDFGGLLVKANSEGQPGPQDYKRTHADGANMLAEALERYGGIVMWRAFVYAENPKEDRHTQAYKEFQPLDGTFRPNVLVQVKNGPIDFQPREPFSPLFGAMPKTPLMLELQITKEYLGFATHLSYLAPLFEEVLRADTYVKGEGSLVRQVIDGTMHGYAHTGIAGVANTGTDRNWCGSVLACANWHAFGRLAWNPSLTSSDIADEWLRMTFTNDTAFIAPVKSMMLASRQATVDYMTPLGLHHQMARGHHYGPGPWVTGGPRADQTSVYYNRADANGIGFDRTATGSNAVAQYAAPVRDRFANLATVTDDYLLWFHHVPWDYKMASGRILWDELTFRYCRGIEAVQGTELTWQGLSTFIDAERYEETRAFLAIQENEARWWRDASVLYFQTFSKRPIQDSCGPPADTLEHYMSINLRYVPGN
ncbi:MAG TPA: alpha-glucuronidase family glycosyl hydrolase [Vicinamibacterales bacterium]|nr:alpha-glucuronidase family glycosyl hydrolase [Vicinamibacterales bacterium]